MILKKKIILSLTALLIITNTCRVVAQSNEIGKITEQIKASYELEKLNDCRLKLRAIEFSQLKTKEEKEQYAAAYRQLALAFRDHRYSRPAYDIYQKFLSLRDTILTEERSSLISETLKSHADKNAAVLDEIAAVEKEKKILINDKTTLDGLKKNNFRYSIFFTIALLTIFIFILMKYNSKLKSAKSLLHSNRKNIFEKSDEVIRGQMSLGVLNHLKFLNENIISGIKNTSRLYDAMDKELKNVKETEQPLKILHENIEQIKQLSGISLNTIENALQKISRA